MIEVEGEILRGNSSPVFFVGETIECEIRFRCVDVNNKTGKAINTTRRLNSPSDLTSNKLLDDATKMAEISDSMFAVLASYPSQTSLSTLSTTSSVATTPSSDINFPLGKINSTKSFSLLQNVNDDGKQTNNVVEWSTASFDPDYVIAWACVQIDCNCHIDESRVILPKNPLRYNVYTDNKPSNEMSNTSFQPNKDRPGISVYSSKPKILFCNLVLRPNETRSFIYKETLPYDLAPSFRGQFARYSYKLTIGAQKLNRNTQLLRLPFKVYSLLDFDKFIPKAANAIVDEETYKNKRDSLILDQVGEFEDIRDAKEKFNPFVVEEKSELEGLEYALQALDDLTSRLNITHYSVANEDGKIVKITMNKTNFKIGEKLIVFLDFTEAQIPCIEFKVTLQSEEVISEECRKKSNQTFLNVNSHVEIKEHTLFVKKTNFSLQIPVLVTPTFVSDIISLRWRLHFDFALSKTNIQKIQRSNDPVMSLSWRPPSSLTVQVLSWDLPIIIHPFDPFVASDLIIPPPTNDSNKLRLN